jgi:5-methylcytosine-specific restriction endonuclease McrA
MAAYKAHRKRDEDACDECLAACRAYTSERYHSDPEFRDRTLSKIQNRRVSRLGLATITSPTALIAYLVERDHGICGICDLPVDQDRGPMRPSIDHIVSLSNGGEHVTENLQLAHYRCNLRKGARDMVNGV